MPASGVELREPFPSECISGTAGVGRPIQRVVVQQERGAVGRELHVELDHAVAVLETYSHRCERVLRRELAGTAVRGVARIRPVQDASRRPLSTSNRYTRSAGAASAIGSPTTAFVPCCRRAMTERP